MRKNKLAMTDFETLNDGELPQGGGCAYGVDDFKLGFYELEDLEHLTWTGGSGRPVTWGEIAASGKQVYIDGVAIDTDGKLGPRA